ncbi:MAG TPA: hypothetical protein VGY56_01380 [Verrucomicrobiae bacterium]|nr:hypothetical protein [Verrucomicrobiae bacterium]
MKTFFVSVSTILSIFIISSAAAQSLYWDPGQTVSSTAGGSGNWDTTSTFWFNGASDGPWTSGDDAFFEGTAGTLTLMANTTAADLYFTNTIGNYYITNATGAEVLTVNNTIDTGGGEHTIAAHIANSGTLTKNGVGRLHLPVDNTAGLTGSVMINQGSVSIETNNAPGAFNTITVADGAAVEFNGGLTNNENGYNNLIISGTGITNSGSLRNVSGATVSYGTITVAENNSIIYADSGIFHSDGGLSANGDYNLFIGGHGSVQIDTGTFNLGAGSLTIEGPATFNLYPSTAYPASFANSVVEAGATFGVNNDGNFGTVPASLITTNVLVDGGTLASVGTYTMNGARGITVTTNGGTLICSSGTWTTCNIYSSNAPVTLTGAGSFRPGGAAGTTLGTINLGTGAFIKGGGGDCNMGYANASLEIYSNLVLNGGSLSFNYDASGGTSSLGAVPSTLNPSNIWFNGGSMHVGHSTTIGATRGIYVASGGGTIEDVVSSGGTVTINSPISGPGNMNFPNGHGGKLSAIVLTANNTYAGTTTIGVSNAVTVGSGSTSGTLGTGDTVANGPLTFNRAGAYTYGGNISGNSNLINSGSGVITLTGKLTYVGTTTIGGGTLLIDNTNGSSAVTVNSGGALGGTGIMGGPTMVNAGGKLALGADTLSFSNNLSIAGNVTVFLNKSLTPSSGMAIVTGTLTRSGAGTLVVTNLGPSLAAGDTFQVFSQPLTGGGTMAVSGGGMQWANNLAADGTISVVGPLPQPVINSVSLVGTNLVYSGTNGYAGGQYYVLASTNLMSPLSSWKPVSTNTFLTGGLFSVTNVVSPGTPASFFTIKLQ